ncbi:hypothetical protein [Butyricimonas hominis]|uniref:Uncharacterized protein n=1 Tax=Butyricimonas hominis TaxID=2763032 RepID=A0ABR7D1D5_9BACT|nr:hypothetical protein [Butyricimonas hominis]MBC5621748.1 hypothetical protein [Butyricimonas hominis]
MTAAEFVTAIRAITPNECELSMMPEGFAQIYLGELHIGDKKGHHITESNDAVIDLINNYDVSKLTIMIFSFVKSDDLRETDRFIYFGWREAFPLAILKETGEIVEIDWADDERIMSYIATDQQSYLDLLFALEQNSQSAIFSEKNKWGIEHVTNIAGGSKYKENLLDLLS